MPPAMMMLVVKWMPSPRIWVAEATAAGEHRQRRDRDRADRGDPQAGDDLRRRQRQLDPPEDLALGQAHAAGRVFDRRRGRWRGRRWCCGR